MSVDPDKDEKSGDELRREGNDFARNADVEEVGNPGGNEGDEEEYVTQQWALQDRDEDKNEGGDNNDDDDDGG